MMRCTNYKKLCFKGWDESFRNKSMALIQKVKALRGPNGRASRGEQLSGDGRKPKWQQTDE